MHQVRERGGEGDTCTVYIAENLVDKSIHKFHCMAFKCENFIHESFFLVYLQNFCLRKFSAIQYMYFHCVWSVAALTLITPILLCVFVCGGVKSAYSDP